MNNDVQFNTNINSICASDIYSYNCRKYFEKKFKEKPEDLVEITGKVTNIHETQDGNTITFDDKLVVKNCYFTLKEGKTYKLSVDRKDVINLKEGD